MVNRAISICDGLHNGSTTRWNMITVRLRVIAIDGTTIAGIGICRCSYMFFIIKKEHEVPVTEAVYL